MALFHQLRSLSDQKNAEWDKLDKLAMERTKASPTAPMPCLSHLTKQDYDHVYEPGEDTYLLLDAVQHEFDQGSFTRYANGDQQSCTVLEIGCGTGVVTVFFRNQWKRSQFTTEGKDEMDGMLSLSCIVTDVNEKALKVTFETDRMNNHSSVESADEVQARQQFLSPLEGICCDLATPLMPRLERQVDVLFFNPPYVPTDDKEIGCHDISAAWAGGLDGRRVIDRAVPQICRLLRPCTGVAYIVTVDDNRPAELAKFIEKESQGEGFGKSGNVAPKLSMKPFFRRRARNEHLTIQKCLWT